MLFRRAQPEAVVAKPLPSFEELASSLRYGQGDLKELMPTLADKLEADLGEAVEVVWTGSAKQRRPLWIFVRLQDQPQLVLNYDRGRVSASVGGQDIPFADWFPRLHEALALAEQGQQAALANIDVSLTGLSGRPALDEIEPPRQVEPVPVRGRAITVAGLHPEIGAAESLERE